MKNIFSCHCGDLHLKSHFAHKRENLNGFNKILYLFSLCGGQTCRKWTKRNNRCIASHEPLFLADLKQELLKRFCVAGLMGTSFLLTFKWKGNLCFMPLTFSLPI